jgi:hypothetical protein
LTFSGEQFEGQNEKMSEGIPDNPAKAGESIKGIDDWREGLYEPLGYQTGFSAKKLSKGTWGNLSKESISGTTAHK